MGKWSLRRRKNLTVAGDVRSLGNGGKEHVAGYG